MKINSLFWRNVFTYYIVLSCQIRYYDTLVLINAKDYLFVDS